MKTAQTEFRRDRVDESYCAMGDSQKRETFETGGDTFTSVSLAKKKDPARNKERAMHNEEQKRGVSRVVVAFSMGLKKRTESSKTTSSY